MRSQPITSRINSDPDKDVVDHYVILTKDPNPYDDTTVGIAFRGSACVAKGKLIVSNTPSRFSSQLLRTVPFIFLVPKVTQEARLRSLDGYYVS